MTLLEKISQLQADYTKTDRLIAEYIIKNPLEFTISTIGDVASELKISKTSLIRFSKKFGFDGYIGFRKKLQDEEILKRPSADRFKDLMHKDLHANVEKLKLKEIDNVLQCFDNLKIEKIQLLIEKISSSKRIFCAGRDVASYLAQILSYKMQIYGYPFEYIDMGRSSYEYKLLFADRDDMIMLFDLPIYSEYLKELLAFAKSKGMFTATVTDYATSPLVPDSDLVFYCDSQTELFNNSMMAPLFFINILMSITLYHNKTKMIEFLRHKEPLKKLKN